jgi:hypothetical protein
MNYRAGNENSGCPDFAARELVGPCRDAVSDLRGNTRQRPKDLQGLPNE